MLLPRVLSTLAVAAGIGGIVSIGWTLFEQSRTGKRLIRGWLASVGLLALFGIMGPLRATEATLIYNGCHSFAGPVTASPATTNTPANPAIATPTLPPLKLALLPPTFCDSLASAISHPPATSGG